MLSLPDHFIGAQQQALRDRDSKCLRSFQVNHELELSRLLDGQIGGPRAYVEFVLSAARD
jgi:hypothetical protein